MTKFSVARLNRRETIKKLLAATGTLATLPAWAEGWSRLDVNSYQSLFAQDQQSQLASVVDTIIPPANGIGALSVGVDKFLIKLIEKCYEPAVGENVKKQLEALNTSGIGAYAKPFTTCDQSQREALLLLFANSENKDENDFFKLIKSETIRGFNTSKEVMTQHLGYKMAPGHYYGCVDVKSS